MYGIIIEGVRYMIEDHYGASTLSLVLEQVHLGNLTFSTHDRYSEKIIPHMLTALAEISGHSPEEVGVLAGKYFVRFMMRYGHAELMKILGRRFSDFLKGLDQLHEYFRFSYPKIRPPSFYCDRETTDGLTLHYRSRRSGYINYVMGQLIEIAKVFFYQDITVELVRKEEKKGFQYVLLRISFDNKDHNVDQELRDKSTALNEFLPVDSLSVLGMFPYFIAFNKRMEIIVTGTALEHIIPDLIGKKVDEEFDLMRPAVKFNWDACHHHLNNLFELETMFPVTKKISNASIALAVNDQVEDKVKIPDEPLLQELLQKAAEDNEMINTMGNYLHLKGPMVYLKHSELILYLPTVLIDELDNLFDLGLYMNDYSASDCNREIIMASVQKSDDLKDLLKREKEKSRTLANNMKNIDVARQKTKELLSQMMPREIANELLQSGNRSVQLCESFDEATLAFAKIVEFNNLTKDLQPMGIVSLLNACFSQFDDVVSLHGVYKVETIGESYMVSCGVPYPTQNNAEYVGDVALDMIRAIQGLSKEMVEGKTVQVKVGMHSGSVVGGVVGLRAPRYCLFGDTVNVASRLESHNKQPMSIQISVKAKVLLEKSAPGQFQFESRGTLNLKGKGEMLAFGLLSKKGPPRSEKHPLANNARDSDEESGVYTPIDDFDENGSRTSEMSRMSISIAGSRTGTRSRGSQHSRASGRSASVATVRSDHEDDAQAKQEEDHAHAHHTEEGRKKRLKMKAINKERKKKEKAERTKKDKKQKDKMADKEEAPRYKTEANPRTPPAVAASPAPPTFAPSPAPSAAAISPAPPKPKAVQAEPVPKPKEELAPKPKVEPAPKPKPEVVQAEPAPTPVAPQPKPKADPVEPAPVAQSSPAASKSKPLAAASSQPDPPAPSAHTGPGHTSHSASTLTASTAHTLGASTSNKSFLSVHAQAAANYEKPPPPDKKNDEPSPPQSQASKKKRGSVVSDSSDAPKANGTVPSAKTTKANGVVNSETNESHKTGKMQPMPSIDSVSDEELDGIKRRNVQTKKTPPPSVIPESVTKYMASQQEKEPPKDDTKVTASKGKKANLITADQIKEEARSIVANQMKAMEEILKPQSMDKTSPLPPISRMSMEEELDRLNTNKKPSNANGYVVTINENLPAECICGRYKETQVIKTKACSLM